MQFSFGHNEFRCTTFEAGDQFWEYPNYRRVETLQYGRADAHLSDEFLLFG
jgi:hypothetical protein